ncbi:MAG TPA: sulfatase [Terriglobales bacterium]|nr:sulfatase [Terriglobales bacterium]
MSMASAPKVAAPSLQPLPITQFLVLGAWFGLVTGLVEGIGLMVFQRVNWENWGRMLHVSGSIMWVSPLVDLLLFTAIALGCALLSRLFPRMPMKPLAVSLFAGLAVYDWLCLTERLYPLACLSMGIGAGVVAHRWFLRHESHAWFKKTLPRIFACACLAFVGVEGSRWWSERSEVASLPPAASSAPNVLLVILDALRADHVSAYGYPRPTSPEIDRLAREGTLFENAIAPSSWSLPSHVSLITGRYPHEHGAENAEPQSWFRWEQPSFHGYRMLGEALAQQGYRTGAFSGNRVFFTANNGFGRGFQHFADYFQSPKDAILRTLYGREFVRLYLSRNGRYVLHKRADVINAELTDWIDRDRQRPFFAVLNYFDVHDPYGGPGGYPKPAWGMKTEIDEYDAGLKYSDDYLSRLLKQLQRREMDKNTIVIITSDHGESLGEHGLRTHSRALYWELLHVPLVIWYPAHVPAGVRVSRPVAIAAVPATVMDLVAPGAKEQFPGLSLAALWKTPALEANWPPPISELARNPYPEKEEKPADQVQPTSTTGALRSLVTPQWHLIAHENLGDQLYDWVHDPRESNNLIYSPEGRATALQLRASLPSVSKLGTSNPKVLADGTFDFTQPGSQAVDHYYRVLVAPGARVTIEIHAKNLKPTSHLDPVLALEDQQGETLRSCRNPGDDRLPRPVVSDPTPNAFDDLCLSDDVSIGTNTDSRLEFLAPASSSQVEVYVHVLDWNQLQGGRKSYQLSVSGAMRPSETGSSGASATN